MEENRSRDWLLLSWDGRAPRNVDTRADKRSNGDLTETADNICRSSCDLRLILNKFVRHVKPVLRVGLVHVLGNIPLEAWFNPRGDLAGDGNRVDEIAVFSATQLQPEIAKDFVALGGIVMAQVLSKVVPKLKFLLAMRVGVGDGRCEGVGGQEVAGEKCLEDPNSVGSFRQILRRGQEFRIRVGRHGSTAAWHTGEGPDQPGLENSRMGHLSVVVSRDGLKDFDKGCELADDWLVVLESEFALSILGMEPVGFEEGLKADGVHLVVNADDFAENLRGEGDLLGGSSRAQEADELIDFHLCNSEMVVEACPLLGRERLMMRRGDDGLSG